MASSGGTWSSSSPMGSSSQSEEELLNQRKQKRKLSNRESARRSRLRKQNHLADLMAQVSQVRKENGQILIALGVTTQNCAAVEAENAILRAQAMEFGATLQSLEETMHYVHVGGSVSDNCEHEPWSLMAVNQQQHPFVMPSADVFQYY